MNPLEIPSTLEFLDRARAAIKRLDLQQRLKAAERFGSDPAMTRRRLFNGLDDEQWSWVSTVGVEQLPVLTKCLPPLPSKETQLRFTGDSGQSTLQRAFAVYLRLRSLCATHQVALDRVLEFGCGWGRILRFFVRDLEVENIFGMDVHPEMVRLCNSSLPWARITRCEPQPPALTLPDTSFDLIYAYSVFTHISEATQLAWLSEFNRVLRPGGLLVLTTRPRAFIEMCAQYSTTGDTTSWKTGLKKAFPHPSKTLSDYDQGRFIFAPVGGGDFLSSEFYGEACVPLEYVKKTWTRQFDLCSWEEGDDYQAFVTLRKPSPRLQPVPAKPDYAAQSSLPLA
jgi:SAM-dependent methyltransferase